MKYLLLILFPMLGCRNHNGTSKTVSQGDSILYYPYAPVFASGFDKGRAAYALRVLQLWKELENGDLRHRITEFSDSLRFILPEKILEGKKEDVLAQFQKRRQQFAQVQYYVDAWLPVKAEGSGEQLVYLWGRQDCTRSPGKREYFVLHEIWRFSPEGKIRELRQYLTHPH